MRKFLLAVFCISICVGAFADNSRIKIQYGPWVTNVSETEFTVLWVTEECSLCWVETAPDDGTSFYAVERPVFVETVAGRNIQSRYHSVRITGLEPGHSYRYRIFGKNVVDTRNAYAIQYSKAIDCGIEPVVTTFNCKSPSCRFSVVNDIHAKAGLYSSLLAGKSPSDMDFIVLNGDMVNYSPHRDTVVKYSFQPIVELVRSVPTIYARGNHESRGNAFADVPWIFPSPNGQFYYTFREGPAAFVVLDGAEDKPDNSVEYSGYAHFDEYRAEELEWLKKAVKSPEFASAPVKIAFMHIPPLKAHDAWYTQAWLAENFLPVLNEAGIDLMLDAHEHSYIYCKAGERDNNFPIIVNSNKERVDVTVEQSRILVHIYDASGKETHTHTFKLK